MDNEVLVKREKRNCDIELMRFVGILLIMGHHRYLLGYEGDYLLKNCWAWVDFFFIVTGAFTYYHFRGEGKKSGCVIYTITKLKRFIPLIAFAVVFQYLLSAFAGNDITIDKIRLFMSELLSNGLFEITLLRVNKVLPLWFLSSILATLPVCAYLIKNHIKLWEVVSFVLPILYFGINGVNTKRGWPNDYERAFACMTLGSVAVFAAEIIRKQSKKITWFSILEIMCIVSAIIIPAFNLDHYTNILEPLFVIICAFGLSNATYLSRIDSEFIRFLGKMSMPMYILHWGVGSAISSADIDWSRRLKSALYLFVTLLLSAIYVLINDMWRKNVSRKEKQRTN